MKVAEVMHEEVQWVDPETPLEQVAKLMKENDIGAVPVGENDKLIGMITDRDITVRTLADGRDPARMTARDVMTTGIVYCRTQDTIEEAIRVMEVRKIRRLPVINEKKRMVGMLALGDISHAASRDLTGELMHAVTAHH